MICTATFPAKETRLSNLGLISSKNLNAVSVYFQTHPDDEKGDAIRLKHLLRELAAAAEKNPDLEDWKKIATVMESWLTPKAALHVLFASPQQAIWEEFELPFRSGTAGIDIDHVFHIVPLQRALQRQTNPMVLLVEREHAAIFAVNHGLTVSKVCELEAEPHVCPHDCRTGWSSSIQRHKECHAVEFLDRTLKTLCQVAGELPVIIGCRYDMWAELHPRIPADLENRIVGRFIPMALEMSAEELLEHVDSVLREHDSDQRQALLTQIHDKEGLSAATGLEDVTAALAQGAVKDLVLAMPACRWLHRCNECGRLNLSSRRCADCGNHQLRSMDAEEALVREAAAQGAQITFLENHAFEEFEGVAAFLRFTPVRTLAYADR